MIGIDHHANVLPAHGKIACSRCFGACGTWGKSVIEQDGWLLENNPMAWGSTNPELLVLGFSKGTRQTGKYLEMPFDQIAFGGFRGRLEKALRSLGVLPDRPFADMFTARETDVAFGSLIRCSVAKRVGDKWAKSGDVINALANRASGDDWALACIDQHLSRLPTRTKLVVLMSNDADYMGASFGRLAKVRPSLKRINDVAYSDGIVTFVHIVHCAGTSGNHYSNWMARNGTGQGHKARLADEAVRSAGYRPASNPNIAREKIMPPVTDEITSIPAAKTTISSATKEDAKTINATLEQILREASSRFERHTERPGTKYLSIFVTPNGSPFAVDTSNLTAQPIWLARKDCSAELLACMRIEIYPAARSRNSNLNVVGLKQGYEVVRFYPEDIGQARMILEHLYQR
ncbi:hypothetical protein [Aestuariivirga litoralis]|uniref:hypothetical protein n=1 Tax=Aestuariivirga litoralis TaxID=2650924 RepID=UPI0018C84949|nr:hypothetical protein [Aestuariivirga litoralis]MBG1232573.1 hypothetical protein [Aestuariivirga litoralis]